jgi:hypothetical protein
VNESRGQVKGIEVSRTTVPLSLVRLDALHDCLVIGGHSLYLGESFGLVSDAGIKYRKLPAPLGHLHRKDVGEMVESRTQLISNFTSKKSQLNSWITETHIFGKEPKHTRLEIWLRSRGIRSSKYCGIMLKSPELYTRSFNLDADTV